MFIDALLRVCNAQDFTAVAVSASSIDIGLPGGIATAPQRVLGAGEDVGFAFAVTTAASCTTVKLEIITATDDVLTAGIVVLDEQTRLSADLPVGQLIYMALPPQSPAAGYLRYLGVRVTPAGGAATVSLTAVLTARSLFAVLAKAYAKNFVV